LDGTPTLDTPDGKPLRVGEAAHHTRLPLQRALQGLVELGGLLEVDDVDVAVRGADDEQVVPNVHRVDALLALHGAGRGLAPEVPVLDGLVPRPRHGHGRAVGLEVLDAADRLVVRRDRRHLARRQVHHLGHLVGARRNDLLAVLLLLLGVRSAFLRPPERVAPHMLNPNPP
jgi:hypothetical protein